MKITRITSKMYTETVVVDRQFSPVHARNGETVKVNMFPIGPAFFEATFTIGDIDTLERVVATLRRIEAEKVARENP